MSSVLCCFTAKWFLIIAHKIKAITHTHTHTHTQYMQGFPGGSAGKEFAYKAGDVGLIPGSGRSPGGGHDNPLRYSCLENPMDRGALQATVHSISKNWTCLKCLSMYVHMLHVYV